jgi:hypothetical protein
MSKQFTFKTEKPTGKWKSFSSDTHLIKLDKKQVGEISDEENHEISLYVIKNETDLAKPNNNKNCDWKTITFKKQSKTLEEAKIWLNEHFESINSTYTLKKLED